MVSPKLSRRSLLRLAGAAALPLSSGLPTRSAAAATPGTLTIAYNVNLPSFDPTIGLSAVNPTIQSIYHAIEDAFERGDEIFDLGAGAQEYKSRVADRDRFVTTTSVVPRGRGYLRVRAVLLPRHLRQAAATRLPPEPRQQLKRFLWSRRRRGSEQHH